jgi:isoleucyl-tRNA synthetase
VVLNTEVTPELEAEGAARDMVRAIQQARKDAGLNVSDRIRTSVTASMDIVEAVKAHENLVVTETLTVELGLYSSGDDTGLQITVEKVGA